jgi:predicted  nucleic acid-binding Zn-ribbon protein
MPPQTLERRVESLEQRVTVLEQLPARVDHLALQISQLRDEMRAEFSAVRTEIEASDERVVTTLREEIGAVMTQSRVLYEDLKASLVLIQEGLPIRKRPRGRNR